MTVVKDMERDTEGRSSATWSALHDWQILLAIVLSARVDEDADRSRRPEPKALEDRSGGRLGLRDERGRPAVPRRVPSRADECAIGPAAASSR
jgi:hypothetical protein